MGSYVITTEGEEALTTTLETLLVLAGTTGVKAKIYEIGISFDGTTAAAEPVLVQVMRGNSASQGTSTAATEEQHDPADPAPEALGFHSFTAEPTYTGQALLQVEVHPQGGIFVWTAGPGDEICLDKTANSFIGLRATAPAAVNALAWLRWRE